MDFVGSRTAEFGFVDGGECAIPREVSIVGGGDDGGVEAGVEPEERRRLRWTSPRKTLPMLAIQLESCTAKGTRPQRPLRPALSHAHDTPAALLYQQALEAPYASFLSSIHRYVPLSHLPGRQVSTLLAFLPSVY